jgi:hypothetical protein
MKFVDRDFLFGEESTGRRYLLLALWRIGRRLFPSKQSRIQSGTTKRFHGLASCSVVFAVRVAFVLVGHYLW